MRRRVVKGLGIILPCLGEISLLGKYEGLLNPS